MSTTDAIHIRALQRADLPVLVHMVRELAVYEARKHLLQVTEADLALGLFGESSVAEALLGCVGEDIVSYMIFYPTYKSYFGRHGLWMEDLYVKEHVRGQGMGQAMMAHLARLAVQRGCCQVEWFISRHNGSAFRAYKSMGAQEQEDELLLNLQGEALQALAQSHD